MIPKVRFGKIRKKLGIYSRGDAITVVVIMLVISAAIVATVWGVMDIRRQSQEADINQQHCDSLSGDFLNIDGAYLCVSPDGRIVEIYD